MLGQEHGGQGHDEHESGNDEAQPAHQCTGPSSQAPRAEDGELCRGRAGEEVGSGHAVFELGRGDPVALVDAQGTQQGDVGGRTAETDAPEAAPLSSNGEQ